METCRTDDFYVRADAAKDAAKKVAIAAAITHQINAFDYVFSPIPEVFGERWQRYFDSARKRLIEKHGDKTADLFELAQRGYIYSITEAAAFMRELYVSAGTIDGIKEYAKKLIEPQSYADYEGWAYTLYNGICAELNKPLELLQICALEEFPEDSSLLGAMGIVWFFAAAGTEGNTPRGMDCLFEAADALELQNGIFMFDAGSEMDESNTQKEQSIRKEMGYRGAIEKLKRDPKQAAKSQVKECWNGWKTKPTNYKSKSAFAKDMMAKFDELDSQAVITRWCVQWEREAAK